MGRVAFVTGAATGIARAIAAKLGALDVTDAGSVDRFFDRAQAELGAVEVAINNSTSFSP